MSAGSPPEWQPELAPGRAIEYATGLLELATDEGWSTRDLVTYVLNDHDEERAAEDDARQAILVAVGELFAEDITPVLDAVLGGDIDPELAAESIHQIVHHD